ncbi:MAG: hypothetical protein RL699_2020 [Bacteroidota bacterium]|jgi:hypothetical protein
MLFYKILKYFGDKRDCTIDKYFYKQFNLVYCYKL